MLTAFGSKSVSFHMPPQSKFMCSFWLSPPRHTSITVCILIKPIASSVATVVYVMYPLYEGPVSYNKLSCFQGCAALSLNNLLVFCSGGPGMIRELWLDVTEPDILRSAHD